MVSAHANVFCDFDQAPAIGTLGYQSFQYATIRFAGAESNRFDLYHDAVCWPCARLPPRRLLPSKYDLRRSEASQANLRYNPARHDAGIHLIATMAYDRHERSCGRRGGT